MMKKALLLGTGMVFCLALLTVARPIVHAGCGEGTWACAKINQHGNVTSQIVGMVSWGKCWKWSEFACLPCDGYAKLAERCNGLYYEKCKEYGCAACGWWKDTGTVSGPCYDYKGNKLCDGPPTF